MFIELGILFILTMTLGEHFLSECSVFLAYEAGFAAKSLIIHSLRKWPAFFSMGKKGKHRNDLPFT